MSEKEAMDFMMGSGGKSASFNGTPPIKYIGRVLAIEKRQQTEVGSKALKFWDDGKPMWQIVFTIDTGEIDPSIEDDNGIRNIYAKAQMLTAIRDAIRKSGHQGSIVGGVLGVKYARDGESSKPGLSPPKVYEAMFTPPNEADMLDEVVEDEPAEQQVVEDFGEYDGSPF